MFDKEAIICGNDSERKRAGLNMKIKFIEQTEDSLDELILWELVLCEAYLGISDLRFWANTHRIRPMNEVDLERALIALILMISKRAPRINDKYSPAYGLTCVRLKLRRVRRLVWLSWWKIFLNAGLQAIFGSLN